MRKKKAMGIVVFVAILFFLFRGFFLFNVFLPKSYDNAYFGIETYKSSVDKDNDGIDDQTDILNGVREYIKTNPKYKSKYYETGYPSDEYGVCTDVVAKGVLNAGYDLMELVYEDIIENRNLYSIEQVDKRIDFRRVRNLEVYFKNHSLSLTTDIKEIKEWQGGDIVVFQNHIGIVSDKRNKNGIPFVIHHANPYQIHYEENILEYRNDIIGHYRVS